MEWIYLKGIPIEAQYLYRKGIEMVDRGNDNAALAYFGQAVLLAPDYAKAIFEMGNCLASMGRYDEAKVKYQRAAGVDPWYSLNGKAPPPEERDQVDRSNGRRNCPV